jgi:hypothetical protein
LLFESFPCHQKESDEFFVAFLVLGNVDNHHVH